MNENNMCVRVRAARIATGVDEQLRIPDLAIRSGNFAVVIGLSESLSAIFIRLLAGTYKPLAGEVELWQRPVENINRRVLTGKISVITKKDRPGFSFPVGDFVRQGRENSLQAFQSATEDDRKRAETMMKRLGVDRIAWRDSNLLGHSDLIRALVARSLVQDPDLVLIDNFLHDINENSRDCILNVLHEECHQQGRTVVVTTGDPGPLARYADQLIVFNREELHEQISFAEEEAEAKMKSYLEKWGFENLDDLKRQRVADKYCHRSPDEPLF